MSDTPQGEGWWQASDGKWYAPEFHPKEPPTATVPPTSPHPAAVRRWRLRTLLAVGVVSWVIGVAMGAASSHSSSSRASSRVSTSKASRSATSTTTEQIAPSAPATTAAAITTAPPSTRAPTTTAAPPPTTERTPAPQTFNGHGQTATPSFPVVGGFTVFRSSHDGQSNFIVHLLDSRGQDVDGLVNEIGPFQGSAGVHLDAGSYNLQIEADGNWTIVVEQPRPSVGAFLPQHYTGRGQSVVGPFAGSGGPARFALSHDGESNFIVHLVDRDGRDVDGMVNEIGPFQGSKIEPLKQAIYWLTIEADGNWVADIRPS